MATVLDVGLVSYFQVIFPVLLIFAVVYAALHKTKVIGETAWVNALIAIIAGLLILLSEKAIQIVNFMLPWFAIAILFFILMILLFKVFGLKDESLESAVKDKAVYWTIIGVALAIVGIAFGNAFGQEALDAGHGTGEVVEGQADVSGSSFQSNIWGIITHPKVLGFIVIMTIAVFAIALLSQ